MHLRHHALSTLLLFVGAPLVGALVDSGKADAAIIIGQKVRKDVNARHYRVVVSGADADAAASVAVELRSDWAWRTWPSSSPTPGCTAP